ncbi:MAG: hypothetical protein NC300_11450 [Bacteroidales bacterium]|nr:hypothetical protein [Clostridium sp.]MCM1204747.1 hypothetical protein [Bacteroidales bacterium]
MTVGECIKKWLGTYAGADFSEIATDFIKGDTGSYAIYKSPNKNVVPYIDGSKLITEYYQFFARESTQVPEERIENQQFLSDLENWVEKKDYSEDYPDLSEVGNLTCMEISISNSAAITSQEDDNAIYQITIEIQYLKEE